MKQPLSPPPPPPSAGGRPAAAPHSSRRRGPLASFLRFLALLAALMFGAFLLIVAVAWFVVQPRTGIEDESWVELRFTSDYPEERPDRSGLRGALQPVELSAQDVHFALRRAVHDRRVAGILLRPDAYPGGWAQAWELRQELTELRESGKRVHAYLENSGSLAYFIASVADSITIAPEGNLLLTGLQARLTFLKGSLDKLGVGADFVGIGEYKSAPEQLTQEGPSEPSRRQTAEFLDDLYDEWLQSLAQARGLTAEHMMMLVDRGPYDAQQALAEGLVDVIHDEGAVLRRDTDGDAKLLHALDYIEATHGAKALHPVATLALLYAEGTIVPGLSRQDGLQGAVLGSESLVAKLRRAREDDEVEAVVLRVNSPGGSALASDLIHRELLRVRDEKPVVVSMGNLAASGGYYISMSADRIVADPLSLTGSIGVYSGKLYMGELYEKLGLSFETFQRGENADLYSDLQPFRPEQRQHLQLQLDRFYQRFVARVADGRNMSPQQVDEVARGRIWSGRRAVERGLVDELGGLELALRRAKELAGIDPDLEVRLRTYQPEPDIFDRTLNRWVQRGSRIDDRPPASAALAMSARVLRLLRTAALTLDGSAQYHLPWSLSVR